jgi:hypothetical protein
MIWPFNRDLLESDADLLVGAVNTLAISMLPKFIDEFTFIPHDERLARPKRFELLTPRFVVKGSK